MSSSLKLSRRIGWKIVEISLDLRNCRSDNYSFKERIRFIDVPLSASLSVCIQFLLTKYRAQIGRDFDET